MQFFCIVREDTKALFAGFVPRGGDLIATWAEPDCDALRIAAFKQRSVADSTAEVVQRDLDVQVTVQYITVQANASGV